MFQITKQRHRAISDLLASFRSSFYLYVWTMILAFPVGAILIFAGVPHSATKLLVLGAMAGTPVLLLYNIYRTLKVKPLVCLCDDSYDKAAATQFGETGVCGFCGKTHPPWKWIPWRRTVLDECDNIKCKRSQHSIICWRCNKPIIWDDGAYRREPTTSAWHLQYPPLQPVSAPTEDRPPRRIAEHLH
jgi:hypothetical protein